MTQRLLVTTVLSLTLASAVAAAAAADPTPSPADDARRLLSEGKDAEAFLKYLTVPGCEHEAVEIARPKSREFLDVLADKAKEICPPRRSLIQGDLLLAAGKKTEALAAYRAAAGGFAQNDRDGWDKGVAPRDYYFVEPPGQRDRYDVFGPPRGLAASPMTYGLGSHRDNWLIRRFIAMEAWDDAAAEFARVWEIHRRAASPYVVRPEIVRDGEKFSRPVLVEPSGFTGKGLQFALDYAYFRKTRKQAAESLEIALAPLLVMDMTRNGDLEHAVRIVTEAEAAKLPPRDYSPPARNYFDFTAGISRKEFIRLAYGMFKAAGKEADLLSAIRGQIDKGENRARLVLARMLTMADKTDQAVELELAYVDNRKLEPFAAACCRGMVYDRYTRPQEAIAEYEKALVLPPKPPPQTDAEEETLDQRSASAIFAWSGGINASWLVEAAFPRKPTTNAVNVHQAVEPSSPPWNDFGLIDRLKRLYVGAGNPQRVLELTRMQFEKQPSRMDQFAGVEDLAARFRTANKEADFNAWADKQLAAAKDLPARLSLLWLTGRQAKAGDEAIAAIAAGKPGAPPPFSYDWPERIRQFDPAAGLRMRKATSAAHPEDLALRLELLADEGVTAGPQYVKALEDFVDCDRAPEWDRMRATPLLFDDPFHAALHLMRLYEKEGKIDKLIAMGLKVARGQKLLSPAPQYEWQYRGENKAPEYAPACLALLMQHADDAKTQAAVAEAIQKCPWPGAREQLARRRAGGVKPPENLKPFGWSNLPKGVVALASCRNVLALAADGKHIFAGHPWGVAIYDRKGQPVTRVSLAGSAQAMVIRDGVLWAGSDTGLHRIDLATYGVSFLPMHVTSRPGQEARLEPPCVVNALAVKGDNLWIATTHDVRRLDTRTMDERIFTPIDLGLTNFGRSWSRILLDGDDVWIDGQAGCLRYDAKTDTWSRPEIEPGAGGADRKSNRRPASHLVALMDVIDGELWGHVWVNEELRDRPCIIDRTTLRAKPILIEGLGESESMLNGPFFFAGRRQGQLVFSEGQRLFAFDAKTRKLRRLAPDGDKPTAIESDVPAGLSTEAVWRDSAGVIHGFDKITHIHKVGSSAFDGGECCVLRLPDGRRVLGGKMESSDTGDLDGGHFWELSRDLSTAEGGLFFITPQGELEKFGYEGRDDVLASDYVFGAVSDEKVAPATWLYTEMGLAAMDERWRIAASLTRDDGLAGNLIHSAASLAGKFYFASGWGDAGGGLIVYDPKTAVFTALFTGDGLSSNKLAGLEAANGKLRITYGVEYLPRVGHPGIDARSGYLQCAPSTFDPADGAFTSLGQPTVSGNGGHYRGSKGSARTGGKAMPILGGLVNATSSIGDKTVCCGTRGVVIADGENPPQIAMEPLKANEKLSDRVRQIAEALARKYSINSPADLAEALKDKNPYVRAQALAAIGRKPKVIMDDYLDQIATQVGDANVRVRSTAACQLFQVKDQAKALPLWRKLAADSDFTIRSLATVAMARAGQKPDVKLVRELLAWNNAFRNPPFGADLAMGIATNHNMAYPALAPVADEEMFAVMLEFPYVWDGGEREGVMKSLGESVRKHPAAVAVLLKAYDDTKGEGHIRFAQDVLGHAGKDILGELHKALAGDDRVIRSNAALACGAVGDPSSIDPLIQALDLESGLARASIVWALGELKAAKAADRLAALYQDALRDQKRRSGSGYRGAQQASAMAAQYETIENLDSISAQWDELKASAQPAPIDPRRNETLLEPARILEAVKKIGPEASQGWYRGLAAAEDDDSRLEAAQRLADGAPADAPKNVSILRNLINDGNGHIRIAAAVSLLMLHQDDMQKPILDWLKTDQDGLVAMQQLRRVADARKLAFCRDVLEELASKKNPVEYSQRAARAVLDAAGMPH